MTIRMIATDIDGTLLPRGGAISDATRRAVAGCRERGIPFIIVSGRWIGALGDVIRQAGTEDQPVIIVNGSAVLGPGGETWHERFMDPADVEAVYGVLRRYDVQINSYTTRTFCIQTGQTEVFTDPYTAIAQLCIIPHSVFDLPLEWEENDRNVFYDRVGVSAQKVNGGYQATFVVASSKGRDVIDGEALILKKVGAPLKISADGLYGYGQHTDVVERASVCSRRAARTSVSSPVSSVRPSSL